MRVKHYAIRASLPLLCLVASAQPRIDNVLVRMVPPGTTSMIGARMDQIRATEFYRRLVDQRKLTQVDRFARDTGFDPRRDVRELLFAATPSGGVMLARGSFRIHGEHMKNAKPVRHGEYTIWTSGNSGFCVLDNSLAAAGDAKSIVAALDEWKSGSHKGALPLLAHAKDIDAGQPFWGVSTEFGRFLADHMSTPPGGIDFSKIFRGIQEAWFQSDFSNGVKGSLHGLTASEQDAVALRDTAKGLIGLGRLSVPENQPDLLKLWDGIEVEQPGRSIAIRADIPQSLVDQLVKMARTGQLGPGNLRKVIPLP